MTKKRLWTCLAALACVFWGISGLFAKGLFNISSSITPIWISQVRMVVSGVLLLIFAQITGKRPLKTMTDKKMQLLSLRTVCWGYYPCNIVTSLLFNKQMPPLLLYYSLLDHFLSYFIW